MMREWIRDGIGTVWQFECDTCHTKVEFWLNKDEIWQAMWDNIANTGWSQRYCPKHRGNDDKAHRSTE